MRINFLYLISAVLLLYLVQICPVHGGGEGDENTEELKSLFSKLVKGDPIVCPTSTDCLCIEFKAKKDIPLRYKYSQWCSADADNNRPLKGSWEVTNFDTKWKKVEEGMYLNGLMHGTWATFDKDGNVVEQITYTKGKIFNN